MICTYCAIMDCEGFDDYQQKRFKKILSKNDARFVQIQNSDLFKIVKVWGSFCNLKKWSSSLLGPNKKCYSVKPVSGKLCISRHRRTIFFVGGTPNQKKKMGKNIFKTFRGTPSFLAANCLPDTEVKDRKLCFRVLKRTIE